MEKGAGAEEAAEEGMTRVWLFKRGGLFESTELALDRDKFTVDALGYRETLAWESVTSESMRSASFSLHGSLEENAKFPYLVAILLCGRNEFICVEDFPVLLELFRLLKPLLEFDRDRHFPVSKQIGN